MLLVSGDPYSMQEAMQPICSIQRKTPMKEEFEFLNANKTWEIVNLPAGAKSVKSKWGFKTNRDESGNIVRWKAKLVSNSFSQRAGIDFKRRFHPLSDMILGICCRCKARYERLSNGIVCAYLNATVKVVVYMKQP